jgi:IgGFc binding protein/CHU_C Type IX secretion signal domain/SprB repeat
MKRILTLIVCMFTAFQGFCQLDSIHFMPPMHARNDWGPQYFYLSTPEKAPFEVTLRDGTGNLIKTVTISNTQPHQFEIGSSNTTFTLVPEANLHQSLKNKGIVASGKKKFYAYFRTHAASKNQSSDLTCKGRAALGKIFRIGHLLQEIEIGGASRSNFIGIMATEDSTNITLSGFDPNTDFRKNGADTPSNGIEKVTLQKGECMVMAQYIGASAAAQPPNGMMGSLVESTKPIAINCGSWYASVVTTTDKDSGIDQIVPVESVGKEYILCKGNGAEALERPVLVAHSNDTKIWLNGNSTPIATLNAGQYYAVLTSAFTNDNNLHIKTSQPIYVYQMIGGANTGSNIYRTGGLIFVPPISCSVPNKIDNIFEPNSIGTMVFDGGAMITAMRDSAVTVLVNGAPANIGAPSPVQGNPDFVTYRNISLFSQNNKIATISVVAQGAVQVAMYGQNNAASYAAFYSGFSKTKAPNIKLTRVGDGVCPDTLRVAGLFDGVQWMYEDSIVRYGKDTTLVIYGQGKYAAVGYLGVCRQSETAVDTLSVSFISPKFPYNFSQPSCFGYTNGQIRFGNPSGGLPPYQFSINNGVAFSKKNKQENLAAGTYRLVVRDSLGCYNRPLTLTIGQPQPLKVTILPKTPLPDAVPLGEIVKLYALPSRKIVTTKWQPSDNKTCANCLDYTFSPLFTTNVQVTVTDSAGCMATNMLPIYVLPNVYVPNVIHPFSQEDKNAYFTLFSKDALPIKRLDIYDRWGEQVFHATNITTNARTQGWDGTLKGRAVAADVYVFFAEVEVLPNKVVMMQGSLTVVY